MLAPQHAEHSSLEALLSALDAARAARSDGEAGVTDRIQLHLAAAQAYQRAADLATAQWHSYEALRLSMQSSASALSRHGEQSGGGVAGMRGWRAAGLRLAALLQGGQLCEASGSPEEALDGFKQAQKLVTPFVSRAHCVCSIGRLFASFLYGILANSCLT